MAVFSLQWISKLLNGSSTMSVQMKLLKKSKLRIRVRLNGETEALRRKIKKSAGTDGISPELLKCGAEEVIAVLRPLLLEIWKTNKIPSV